MPYSQESALGSFLHAAPRTRMPLPAAVAQHLALDGLSMGPSASAKLGNALNLCPPAAGASAGTSPTSEGAMRRATGLGARAVQGLVGIAAPEAAWQGARMRTFVNSSCVAAQFVRPSAGTAFEEPAPGEALTVSDDAVSALVGLDRAALLRVIGLQVQVERQKEWKLWSAQKQQMEASVRSGKRVPSDFCQQVFFYTFQFERVSLLASSPVLLLELEQWAWMLGRWVIADVADMTKSSDFLHILTKADELAARLSTFSAELRRWPVLPVSQTRCQEMTHLLLRFTTVQRGSWLASSIPASAAGSACWARGNYTGIRDHLPHLRAFKRSLSASLPGFLKGVEDQIATQSVLHTDKTAQQVQDYCWKALLCFALAFICGQGGAAPMSSNPLDDPLASAAGVGVRAHVSPFMTIQPPQIASACAAGSRRGRLVIVAACILDRTAAPWGVRSVTRQ
jgi:hypothetical protein